VPSDDKKKARLNCISHLLSQVEYEELEHPVIELPELNKEGYVRAPIDDQTFVPDKY
ncbi:polyphosphate kinase 2, partial [Vibrio owensii]